MKTWEYMKIMLTEASRGGDEIDLLCDAGSEGWELVAVLPNGLAYLKREVLQSGVASVEQFSKRRRTSGCDASCEQPFESVYRMSGQSTVIRRRATRGQGAGGWRAG